MPDAHMTPGVARLNDGKRCSPNAGVKIIVDPRVMRHAGAVRAACAAAARCRPLRGRETSYCPSLGVEWTIAAPGGL
jgi:hypothetical protein